MRTTLIAALLAASSALAHDGPPYAIVVAQPIGVASLSVWADPDVGTGTFYVYLEALDGQPLPADARLTVTAQPADGRIPEASYAAVQTRAAPHDQRFRGQVRFDTVETWRVGFVVESAGRQGRAETEVQVTPPGQGPMLDFVLNLFPFVAAGGLVLKFIRRRGSAAGREQPGTS